MDKNSEFAMDVEQLGIVALNAFHLDGRITNVNAKL